MAIPLEPGDEGYEIREDRTPDYRIAEFNVWDPVSSLDQKDQPSLISGHTALVNAFDSWAMDLYPQAQTIGDVIAIQTGTFQEQPKAKQAQLKLPKGAIPIGTKWLTEREETQ